MLPAPQQAAGRHQRNAAQRQPGQMQQYCFVPRQLRVSKSQVARLCRDIDDKIECFLDPPLDCD